MSVLSQQLIAFLPGSWNINNVDFIGCGAFEVYFPGLWSLHGCLPLHSCLCSPASKASLPEKRLLLLGEFISPTWFLALSTPTASSPSSMDATVETPSPAMFTPVSITRTLREKRTDVVLSVIPVNKDIKSCIKVKLLMLVLCSSFFSFQHCLPPLTSRWIPAQTQEISMSTGQLPKHQVNIDCVPHAHWIMPSLDLGLRIWFCFFSPGQTSLLGISFSFLMSVTHKLQNPPDVRFCPLRVCHVLPLLQTPQATKWQAHQPTASEETP